jgi:hypothetical protein
VQESRRLGMNFIMPEHIIIALLSVGDVGARQVVQRYDPRPDTSRSWYLPMQLTNLATFCTKSHYVTAELAEHCS